MAGENLDFKVRVLGIKELVELNNQIQATSKELKEKKKALKTDKEGQQENMKSVLQLTDTLKKQRKEFREGTKQQQKVQQETKKTTSFTMKMATAFGVAQLAVNGFQKVVGFLANQMKDGINVFKEFDFQMQKVRAISGATDLEFKRLKESAEALGRTTFFTATQVAELQTNLSKLGFTAEEILQAQGATLATATATGENLARTATVMGSAIRGFGLDASEATRVADVMASAFTSSALDIEKFQTSMTKVAPIAKMAGFEIEGTTAILASLTDAGIEASIAGTSLRNILLRLADPTSKLSKRLGGSVKSVDELLPRLKAMKDEGIALSDVLGITDRRTAAAFGRMLDSADGVAILTKQLRNSEGAAEAMAEIVGDSLQGAMLRFKSATDGLKIALVDLFGENLQKRFDSFAKFFNNLASEKSIKRISKVAKTISTLVKAILLYTIGVKAASLATLAWTKGSLFLYNTAINLAFGGTVRLTGAVNLFRTALIKTGIGAFVVLIGTAIAGMIKYAGGLEQAESWTSKLTKATKTSNEGIVEAQTNLKSLARTRERINELTDKEGKLLNDNASTRKILDGLRKKEKSEIASLNKLLNTHNLELIDEKDNIDKITEAISGSGGLIDAMTNKMLVEAFGDLNKELISMTVQSDMIQEALGENFQLDPKRIAEMKKELEEMSSFRQWLTQDVGGTVYDFILGMFGSGTEQELFADVDMLDALLEQSGLTLQQFLDTLEDGYFEKEQQKIMDLILKKGESTSLSIGDLFSTGKKGSGDDPNIKAVTAQIEEEAQRHSKALLDIGNESYKFESDRNILQLEEEIKHLETMKLLNMKMGEDGLKEDLKIQKKRDKLLKETNKLKLDALKQEKEDRKLQIDEDFTNELMTELQHKQALLDLEAWFLGQKGELIAQDFQAYLENQNAQRQLDIDAIELEKQANQERIQAVDDLGSSMSELGNIMGENHVLTKIGTKLSQAAAVAKNIETLRTILQTKADEAGTTTSLVKMGANAGEGVTKQAARPFPENIAAMAATLAVVVSVLSMFGGGMGGGDSKTVTEGGKFANGGLTKGGMFRGNSHANGGVKFAVGGRIHEAEGGEAIINKRSTSMFKPVLSAINSYNGNGVKFADGGLLNSGEKFARGGQLADIQGMISQQQTSQRVIMVESDVTKTQGKVSAIESQATF
jgi:TP901 family phage tail tape measure protein